MRYFGRSRPAVRRVTFANVVSVLALIVATGGTAFAAATIGSADVIDDSLQSVDIKDETLTARDLRTNAVGTSELAKAAVRTPDLRNNAVTTAKILDGTIRSIDVKDGSLTGDDVQDGSIGLVDLAPSAQTDPRVQTFATVVAYGSSNDDWVLGLSTPDFTFRARCYSAAWVEISSSLPGANFVRSVVAKNFLGADVTETSVTIGGAADTFYGAWAAGHSPTANGSSVVLSGIAPQQGDGSTPAVLVQLTVTEITAGCSFTGTVTDTTSYSG